jgi:RNA polymerase sigma-70 factor (ECF subfamily)
MGVRAEALREGSVQVDPRVPSELVALYEQYVGRLERLCQQRLGPGGDAEDAAHEALLKAWAALDRIDPDRPVWPWLATIARNTCTDIQRRQRLATTRRPLEDVPAADPEDLVCALDRHGVVRRALRELPTADRDLLVLRDVESRSYAEIAARQARSPGAVRMAVARARALLRTRVEELARASGQWPLAGLTGGLMLRVRTRASAARAWLRNVGVHVSSGIEAAGAASMVAVAPVAVAGLATLLSPPAAAAAHPPPAAVSALVAPAPAPSSGPSAPAERPHRPEVEETTVTLAPVAEVAAPQEVPDLLPAVPPLVPPAIAPPGLDPPPASVAQVADVPVARPTIAVRPPLPSPSG